MGERAFGFISLLCLGNGSMPHTTVLLVCGGVAHVSQNRAPPLLSLCCLLYSLCLSVRLMHARGTVDRDWEDRVVVDHGCDPILSTTTTLMALMLSDCVVGA